MSYDISDYVDVKTRIDLFYAKYPEGSIQFEFMGIMPGNAEFIWGIARAYRTAEDPRPFTGTCSELAKGSTNFTRGSELANLETSAIGRCIGSGGIGLGKSIATKQEIQGAQARQTMPTLPPVDVDPWAQEQQDLIAPICSHGHMQRKTGFKKDGNPYSGWTCTEVTGAVRCEARWDK